LGSENGLSLPEAAMINPRQDQSHTRRPAQSAKSRSPSDWQLRPDPPSRAHQSIVQPNCRTAAQSARAQPDRWHLSVRWRCPAPPAASTTDRDCRRCPRGAASRRKRHRQPGEAMAWAHTASPGRTAGRPRSDYHGHWQNRLGEPPVPVHPQHAGTSGAGRVSGASDR
jgi:hypothetical protein